MSHFSGRFALRVLLFIGILIAPAVASAASWYWDGLNGSLSASGSAASPFQQLYQARKVAQPGDVIYVVNSMVYPKLGMNIGGTADAPVTITSADPAHPTQFSGGGVDAGILIYANYVVVGNFDVTAPGPYCGIQVHPGYHHITISNNIVHGAGGDGIYAVGDDYVTIAGNTVYGNAYNTTQAFGSGISIKGSIDIDANTGIKMVVSGNVAYANQNVPNCSTQQCLASASDTDGHGIIIDTNNGDGLNQPPYAGAFLVSSNLLYQNGGGGVHVFKSDNVTITGNTMYFNNQDPYDSLWHPGEISVAQGGNVGIYNNILYSDGAISPQPVGASPNYHVAISIEKCTDSVGPLVASHNIGYNPQKNSAIFSYIQASTNPVSITSNMFNGPKLEHPSGADFRVAPSSPAVGSGDAATSVAYDLLGDPRAPSPSIGAYQTPGP